MARFTALNTVFLRIMMNPRFDENAENYNEIPYSLTFLQARKSIGQWWLAISKKVTSTITSGDFNTLRHVTIPAEGTNYTVLTRTGGPAGRSFIERLTLF